MYPFHPKVHILPVRKIYMTTTHESGTSDQIGATAKNKISQKDQERDGLGVCTSATSFPAGF